MKFMMIVKSAERSGFPPKELMEAIDKLSEEANKSGSMIGGGGLGPTGYAQFELKSKQEAVESAVKFMELHKKHWPGWEGETEIRQMFGSEDFANCKP